MIDKLALLFSNLMILYAMYRLIKLESAQKSDQKTIEKVSKHD